MDETKNLPGSVTIPEELSIVGWTVVEGRRGVGTAIAGKWGSALAPETFVSSQFDSFSPLEDAADSISSVGEGDGRS